MKPRLEVVMMYVNESYALTMVKLWIQIQSTLQDERMSDFIEWMNNLLSPVDGIMTKGKLDAT